MQLTSNGRRLSINKLTGKGVKMYHYRVRWEIDILADDARAAAEEAQRIQRDPESIATVFEMFNENGDLVAVHDLNRPRKEREARP
jgi:hypothetical protein